MGLQKSFSNKSENGSLRKDKRDKRDILNFTRRVGGGVVRRGVVRVGDSELSFIKYSKGNKR